jgi:hypothetical protein
VAVAARRVAHVGAGRIAGPSGRGGDEAGAPRSVQLLELGIDALDIAAVRPFWKEANERLVNSRSEDTHRLIGPVASDR